MLKNQIAYQVYLRKTKKNKRMTESKFNLAE